MDQLRTVWARIIAALALGVILMGIRDARASSPPAATFDHQVWDRLLRDYVDDEGRVAYQCLADESRADLDRYLAALAGADLSRLSRNEQLAFWINAYNAGIVAAVLDGHSPESLFSRHRLFRWYTFPVAGEKRTVDEIEHRILRERFREPRIHFALVCAATSCPKLRREAYAGERLDEQLDDQARRFINDPTRNVIDPATGRVQLSSIFDWFTSDFAAAAGSVARFASRYVATPEQADLLEQHEGRLEHLPYSWSLNAQGDSEMAGGRRCPPSRAADA